MGDPKIDSVRDPLDLVAIERDRLGTLRLAVKGHPPMISGDAGAALRLGSNHVPDLVEEVGRLRLERDAAVALAFGPVCDACDSEPAMNVTPDGGA